MKLFYGMKLQDQNGLILIVERYWPDDQDANIYKVRVGNLSFYSSDLIELIREGVYSVVD